MFFQPSEKGEIRVTLHAQEIWERFSSWLFPNLIHLAEAGLIFLIGWWLSKVLVRLLRKTLARTRVSSGIISFLSSFCRVALQILAGIMAVAKLGVDISSIIAALATAGVAIGLALKDSMSNVASGLQIVFTHPFEVGHYVSLNGVEGTVERIEILFTTLRTFDNKEVVIPNSKITDSVLTNYSSMEHRRLDLKYIVSYKDDIFLVKNILSDLCAQESRILSQPEGPQIAIGEHGENGICVLARVWCKTSEYWPLYFAMQEKVKLAFDEKGITIPFHQMDVHLQGTEPDVSSQKKTG